MTENYVYYNHFRGIVVKYIIISVYETYIPYRNILVSKKKNVPKAFLLTSFHSQICLMNLIHLGVYKGLSKTNKLFPFGLVHSSKEIMLELESFLFIIKGTIRSFII